MNKILLALPILLAFALLIVLITPSATNVGTTSSNGVGYTGMVCIDTSTGFHECKHNIFTTTGQNMTRDILGNFTGLSNIDIIALGNCTSGTCGAVITETTLSGEHQGCGLQRAHGAFAIQTTPAGSGNWTIANTFTSSCNNFDVNATALSNTTTALSALNFAINNFTKVTLQNNDQITVTWYVWVTGT